MKSDLYNTLFIFTFYFELIKLVISICDKSEPYLQDNKCVSKCNNESLCYLDNPIIKKQLLTNIIGIGHLNFRHINFAFNLNGDMVLLSSSNPSSCERVFYGLKNNGRYYFMDGKNETPFYSKNISGENNDNKREEGESLFIQLSNNDTNINGKEYFLTFGKYQNYVELYDFINDDYTFVEAKTIFGSLINSYTYSFFKLSNSIDKYYYIVAAICNTYYFSIKKYSFFSKDIDKGYIKHNTSDIVSLRKVITSCFETERHLILCFIITSDSYFTVIVYDENLNQLNEKIISKEEANIEKIFFKGIHFKEEIGIFAYYLSKNDVSPLITFLQAENETSLVEYNNFVNITLSKVSSNYYIGLNDIIKIDINTVCYSSVSSNKKILNIVLLKIYGDNNSNLSMRFYSINIYNLYNFLFYLDLKAISYNRFISLGLSYCYQQKCKDTNDIHYSSLVIFSYGNSSDSFFDLFYHLSQNNENIHNICFNLEKNTFIENNIFGLQFDGIRILNFSKKINLESCLNNKSIENNYILQKNEEFRISLNKIDEESYLIEFSSVLTEPSYEEMKNFIIDFDDNYLEKKEEYNNLKNKYFGKTSYFTINGLNKISLDCEDELCGLCMKNNIRKCISCKYNGYYDDNYLEKICFDNQIKIYNCSNQNILDGNCQESIYTEQIKEIYLILKSQILNGNFQNKSKIIYTENVVFQISTIEEQKLSNLLNVSSVDLGECEKRLKENESLSNLDNLIMFKMDIKNEDWPSVYVQYEIYNNNTLKKLNLDICKDITIHISVPTYLDNKIESLNNDLNELGYNLFDPNNSFYNDICSTYTSENRTDVLLSDRRNYFYTNISLCQENCILDSYNSTNRRSLCECSVKDNKIVTDFDEIEFSQKLVLKNFYTTLSNSNFRVLKCFRLVFSLSGQINNIGSYIIIIITIIIIILMIIFYIKDNKNINKYIEIILKMNKKSLKKSKVEKNQIIEKNSNSKDLLDKNTKKENYPPKRNKKEIKIIQKDIYNNNQKDIRKIINESKINLYNIRINNKSSSLTNNKAIKNSLDNNDNVTLNEQELNSLDYETAIKIDNRSYLQYYYSLIKRNHIIIFTFFRANDYNLRTIKISLFLISFSLYFVINGFFFSDETMHKVYEDKGAFNFIFQIPQILYSTFVSIAINSLLKLLSLSESKILKLKNDGDKNTVKSKGENLIKWLKIKFLFFFIFSFLFISFFWYYISCFCAVYKNTQIILIKDTLISYGISMIYPFFINLIPGFFRIHSLKSKNKKCIYNFSIFIS